MKMSDKQQHGQFLAPKMGHVSIPKKCQKCDATLCLLYVVISPHLLL